MANLATKKKRSNPRAKNKLKTKKKIKKSELKR